MPKIRYAETNTVNGYYMPHWFSVVMPEETENLILNPSVENDTTGYTAVGAGAAIARTLDEQRRGAYSIRVTPAVGVASGVYYGTIATAINEPYTFSLDVKGIAGHVYNVYFADNAGARVGASYEFTANGYWQRVKITFVEDTGAVVRRLYLVQDAGDVQPFYTDGWQVENKSYDTTYCDGDLTGFVTGEVAYYWTGLYHGSTSVRVSTTRSGGRIVNLREYGFRLLGSQGLGLAPVINYSLPSNLGGAYYQSTVEGVREFSLIGDICFEHYYQVSRAKSQLEQAFSYNLTPYRQPLLLHFQETDDCGVAVGEEVYIKCLYDSGLEGVTDNLTGEKLAIRFIAFDKDALIADGDRAISISTKTPVSAKSITKLSEDGTWDNICSSISFGDRVETAILASDGSIYAAGSFTTIDGVAANYVARYSNGTWSALGVGVGGGALVPYCCVEGPDGRIYFGGGFTTAGGAAALRIAVWDQSAGTWSALGAGLDNQALSMTFTPDGKLVVVGAFLNAGGAPASRIAVWDPATAAWSAVGVGLDNNGERVITAAQGNKVYVSGQFVNGGGVALNNIGMVDINTSTYTALSSGVDAGAIGISSLALDKNKYLHIRGGFTSIGGVTVPNEYAYWNGSQWLAPEVNLLSTERYAISVNPLNGDILIGTSEWIAVPYTDTGVRAKNTTNFQKFGLMPCGGYRNTFQSGDGSILLWGSGDIFLGVCKNDINNTSNMRKAEMVLRQRFFTKTLHLIRCHALNQDASARKVILANETVKFDLKRFRAWSSFVGDITNEFYPGSFISLPDKFSVDVSAFAVDYITKYNDNLNLITINQLNAIVGANENNTTNGAIYLTVLNAGANYWIEFYSDVARANLIGHTTPLPWVGGDPKVLEIFPDGTNGISGYIQRTAAVGVDADIYIEVSITDSYVLWGESYNSLSEARY